METLNTLKKYIFEILCEPKTHQSSNPEKYEYVMKYLTTNEDIFNFVLERMVASISYKNPEGSKTLKNITPEWCVNEAYNFIISYNNSNEYAHEIEREYFYSMSDGMAR